MTICVLPQLKPLPAFSRTKDCNLADQMPGRLNDANSHYGVTGPMR